MMYKGRFFHFVKMSGIGGVQSQFCDFMQYVKSVEGEESMHEVLSPSYVDNCYMQALSCPVSVRLMCLYKLFFSTNGQVRLHTYNNLTSRKAYRFLSLLKTRALVMHEHGNAWNLPKN